MTPNRRLGEVWARMTWRVAIGAVLFLLAACGGSGAPSASVTIPTGPASPAQSGFGPEPPTPGPVPSNLQGTWHEIGTREKIALSSDGFKFFFQPGSFASGTATVTGSTIAFSGSSDCTGTGTYRWTLSGDKLRFVASNADPCPRTIYLNGKTWVRVH